MAELTPATVARAERYRRSLFLTRFRVHTNADMMQKILIQLHHNRKIPVHMIPEGMRYAFISSKSKKGKSSWTDGRLNSEAKVSISPLLAHFREHADLWMTDPKKAQSDFYSRIA